MREGVPFRRARVAVAGTRRAPAPLVPESAVLVVDRCVGWVTRRTVVREEAGLAEQAV
jgi:hypothetical protein